MMGVLSASERWCVPSGADSALRSRLRGGSARRAAHSAHGRPSASAPPHSGPSGLQPTSAQQLRVAARLWPPLRSLPPSLVVFRCRAFRCWTKSLSRVPPRAISDVVRTRRRRVPRLLTLRRPPSPVACVPSGTCPSRLGLLAPRRAPPRLQSACRRLQRARRRLHAHQRCSSVAPCTRLRCRPFAQLAWSSAVAPAASAPAPIDYCTDAAPTDAPPD
jgi:hypothetical protein